MNSIRIPALRFVARTEGQPSRHGGTKSAGIRIPPDPRPGFRNGKTGGEKESRSPKGQKPPLWRRRDCCLILVPPKAGMPFRPGLGKVCRITEDIENHEAFSTNELREDPKINAAVVLVVLLKC